MIEGELYWKPLTEKGEALTKAVAELLNDADEAKVEEEKKAIRAIIEASSIYTSFTGRMGAGRYMDRFNSPVWENFISHVWPVVPVPSYALPVSAMISKITTQDTAYSVTAAGIPVCTLTLP